MATRLSTLADHMPPGPHEAACAYDAVGRDYRHYADGPAASPFAANRDGNPDSIANPRFEAAVTALEHQWATDPAFIERAAHILLVGAKAGEVGPSLLI